MYTLQTESETALFLFMSASHRAIELEYDKLLETLRAGDRDASYARWIAIETQLLAHFEAEERFILPAFAKLDRAEAVALVREHGQFREQLLEIGVSLELHHLAMPALEAFATALRAHATREEELLYRWTAKHLDPALAEAARRHVDRMTQPFDLSSIRSTGYHR